MSRFGMNNCSTVSTPIMKAGLGANMLTEYHPTKVKSTKEAIGSPLSLSTRTHPHIVAAIGILARDSGNPTE